MRKDDAALFQRGQTQKDSSWTGSAIIMNYLTTLLDLCVDDKNCTDNNKNTRRDTASQTTRFTKSCRHGSRTRAHEQANSVTRVFNTGSQGDTKNKTWEASTLTGVLREQRRRDKKSDSLINVLSSQHGSQRCGNINEFRPHLHISRRVFLCSKLPDSRRPFIMRCHWARSFLDHGPSKAVLSQEPWPCSCGS